MPIERANIGFASEISRSIVDGIRVGDLELPVMPQIASKVFRLTQDANADTEQLSQLIHGDQSIASHVLRIANSAAYGNGEAIVSLQQAVTRLGMKLLGEIAIAVAFQGKLFHATGFEPQIKALLRHALASAAFGREIARKRRRNIEGQFLCGLLHSVGRPICYQLIARAQQRLGGSLSQDEAAAIVESLQLSIATKAAMDWKLPRQLQITTAYYANYAQAPAFKDECAATLLSRRLATWLLDPSAEQTASLRSDPSLAYLNLYPDETQDLLNKAPNVRELVSAMEV